MNELATGHLGHSSRKTLRRIVVVFEVETLAEWSTSSTPTARKSSW